MATRREGRQIAVVAGVMAFPMVTWAQALRDATTLGSAEGNTKGVVGEEPEAEDVVGGEGDTAENSGVTSARLNEMQDDVEAGAIVLVGITTPPAELDTPELNSKRVEDLNDTPIERAPIPIIGLDNATDKTEGEPAATTAPIKSAEVPTTEVPAALPKETEPVVAVVLTTKPSLRTEDPIIISNAVTNDIANTRAPGYLDQGVNPLALAALGAICCIFLLLWGRKKRSSPTSSSGTSGAINSKRPNVQYTQVPDEQPFSHSQDDDDEYCDEYEEDTFANDRDNWDDWEGNSAQTHEPQLNPFASVPADPRPTTPRQSNINSSPFQLSHPLPPPPKQQHQQQYQIQLQGLATEGKRDGMPSSVDSDGSSDSFEVVGDETHAPITSSRGAATDVEKESESVDDLFSQFGMVPTFKKSAVVLPPPAATSVTSGSKSAPVTTVSSAASLPTAAEASALFAAEMDDELTAVDAADEWGEDDEWVKGI